jgi:arsenite methyltransferase
MRSADVVGHPWTPSWFAALLGVTPPPEGDKVDIGDRTYVVRDGVLRGPDARSETQAQTADAFGFKWHQEDSFESEAAVRRLREWLLERYGDLAAAPWWAEYGEKPVLLDAGCGAANASLALFGGFLNEVNYIGVDISRAVDAAAARLADAGVGGALLQDDFCELPLPESSVDVVFAEGVLHHTDSTQRAIWRLARHLREGGRFAFYVYRRKGPIREFTDDYVRQQLIPMEPADAWEAMESLTKLGEALGRLNAVVDVPEDVELLEIPAGRYDVQRLFYWHVCKAFYHPDYTVREMNHINYDWYAPVNAHRQSPEEVREWCRDAGLEIEREDIQEAGITVIARRTGAAT